MTPKPNNITTLEETRVGKGAQGMTFEEAIARHLAPAFDHIRKLSEYASDPERGSLDHYLWGLEDATKTTRDEYNTLHEIHKTERLWAIEGALIPASARGFVIMMQEQGFNKIEMIKRVREHLRNRGLHSAAQLHVAKGVVESVLGNWCLEMFPAVCEED